MDGEREYEGRVEICYDGMWGTVCNDGIVNDAAAKVVCKQLRLSLHGELSNYSNFWLVYLYALVH